MHSSTLPAACLLYAWHHLRRLLQMPAHEPRSLFALVWRPRLAHVMATPRPRPNSTSRARAGGTRLPGRLAFPSFFHGRPPISFVIAGQFTQSCPWPAPRSSVPCTKRRLSLTAQWRTSPTAPHRPPCSSSKPQSFARWRHATRLVCPAPLMRARRDMAADRPATPFSFLRTQIHFS